jgi:transglutaminase-like putative cysteine protease
MGGNPELLVQLVPSALTKEGSRFQMTIDLTPLNSRFLPLPPSPVGLRISGNSLRAAGGGWVERDRMRNLRLLTEPAQNIQYEVLHGGPVIPDLWEPPPDDPSRKSLDSSRIAAWVREAGGSLDPVQDPFRFATRIETYLSTRFSYSLDIPLSGATPVEDFLFERQEGHCEAFATAMALAVREVGLPSRFVTGFLGGEEGLFQRYYLVRGRNAHAWVEVWCGPEMGWVTFDPTPASGRPIYESVPWTRQIRNAADSVVFFYDRYILSFGQADQAQIMLAVKEAAGALLESATRTGRWLKDRAVAIVVAVLVLVGLVFLTLLALRSKGKLRGLSWTSQTGTDALMAYRRLQKVLRSNGVPVTPASAPGQVLEGARSFGDGVVTPASAVVDAYVRESFGGELSPSSSEARLKEKIQAVADGIREHKRAQRHRV